MKVIMFSIHSNTSILIFEKAFVICADQNVYQTVDFINRKGYQE